MRTTLLSRRGAGLGRLALRNSSRVFISCTNITLQRQERYITTLRWKVHLQREAKEGSTAGRNQRISFTDRTTAKESKQDISELWKQFEAKPSLEAAIELINYGTKQRQLAKKGSAGSDSASIAVGKTFGLNIYRTLMDHSPRSTTTTTTRTTRTTTTTFATITTTPIPNATPEQLRKMFDALMIFCRGNCPEEGLFIFNEMKQHRVPLDDFFFSAFVAIAVQIKQVALGRRLIEAWKAQRISYLTEKSARICASQLIQLFTQTRDLDTCFEIYSILCTTPASSSTSSSSTSTSSSSTSSAAAPIPMYKPDDGVLSSLLGACINCGRFDKACTSVAPEMKRHGLSLDQSSFGYLTRAISHHKDPDTTKHLVAALLTKKDDEEGRGRHGEWREKVGFHSCAHLITACVSIGFLQGALDVLDFMRSRGIDASGVYSSLFVACGNANALTAGRKVHQMLKGKGGWEASLDVATALINMYGKCGKVEEAVKVFKEVREGGTELDVQTWTAMISIYGKHKQGKAALRLFEEMVSKQGPSQPMPNIQTFTAVLNACSHSGLVEEALSIFNSMEEKFGVVPDVGHCNCVVSALGRAGRLDEAELFISTRVSEPDSLTYRILADACRKQGDSVRERLMTGLAMETQKKEGQRKGTPLPSRPYR